MEKEISINEYTSNTVISMTKETKDSVSSTPQNSSNNSLNDGEELISSKNTSFEQVFTKECLRALQDRNATIDAKSWSLFETVCVTTILYIALILFSYYYYRTITPWGFRDILNFLLDTVTTIGYGDGPPVDNPQGRRVTIFVIIFGMALTGGFISQTFHYIHLLAQRAQLSVDAYEIASKSSSSTISNDYLSNIVSTSSSWHNAHVQFTNCWNKTAAFFHKNIFGIALYIILPNTFMTVLLAAVVGPLEGWSMIDSMYFSVVSYSSVGFGDIWPYNNAAVWFWTFTMPFSLLWVSLLVKNADYAYVQFHSWNVARIKKNLYQKENLEQISNMNDIPEIEDEARALSMTEMLDIHEDGLFSDKRLTLQAEKYDIPPVSLRVLFIKRMLAIISKEVATGNYTLEVQNDDSMTLTFTSLKEVTAKWMIPRRAKNAFRHVSFSVIASTGSFGLRDCKEYFEKCSFQELHVVFAPLLADMGGTSSLKTWLACTELLSNDSGFSF